MTEEEIKQQSIEVFNVLMNHSASSLLSFLRDNKDTLRNLSKTTLDSLEEFQGKTNIVNHVSVSETIKIVSSFLATINPDYSKLLDEFIKHGQINMYDKNDDRNERDHEGAYYKSTYNHEKHKTVIDVSIPCDYNINDAYALVHEFMHHISTTYNESTDSIVLSEVVPITYEFIFYEYLKQNGICEEDNKNQIEFRIMDLINKSKTNIDFCDLFDYSMKHFELLNEANKSFKDSLSILRNVNANTKYLIATLISVVNYYNYKRGKISTKDIENFSDCLNDGKNLKSLNIIGIDGISKSTLSQAIEFLKEEIMHKKDIAL